jgi:hypothetical protein
VHAFFYAANVQRARAHELHDPDESRFKLPTMLALPPA